MKKLLIVAALLIGTVSLAQANENVPANTQDQIQVRGQDAREIVNALEAAGAQARVAVDLGMLNVQNVEAVQGYAPGVGPVAHLSLSQLIPGPIGTHFVRTVTVKADGDLARAVFGALENAGVPVRQEIEFASLNASSIDCSTGLVPTGAVCTIILAQ